MCLVYLRVGAWVGFNHYRQPKLKYNSNKNNKNLLFDWFDLEYTLRWPWLDLRVIPIWRPTPARSTTFTWVGLHHLSMSVSYWSKHDTISIIWSISVIWDGDDIKVIIAVLPSSPHITPVTSWDVFGVPTCCAKVGFNSHRHVKCTELEQKQQKLTSPCLADFTLIWHWDDFDMTLG